MEKANLNGYARVQLTNLGKQILKEKYPDMDLEKAVDEDGWYENQFHQIIQIFGPHMGGFSHLPIGMVYFVEVDDVDDNQKELEMLRAKVEAQKDAIKALESKLENEIENFQTVIDMLNRTIVQMSIEKYYG